MKYLFMLVGLALVGCNGFPCWGCADSVREELDRRDRVAKCQRDTSHLARFADEVRQVSYGCITYGCNDRGYLQFYCRYPYICEEKCNGLAPLEE